MLPFEWLQRSFYVYLSHCATKRNCYFILKICFFSFALIRHLHKILIITFEYLLKDPFYKSSGVWDFFSMIIWGSNLSCLEEALHLFINISKNDLFFNEWMKKKKKWEISRTRLFCQTLVQFLRNAIEQNICGFWIFHSTFSSSLTS